jgi:hypothetical protein
MHGARGGAPEGGRISRRRLYMSIDGLTRFRSLFRLNGDGDYRAVDIFVMPGLSALRTPAIQLDSVRVRFRVTGT